MNDDPLQTPVQFLPGVGPRRAELLGKLGLRTVEDLLRLMPRDVLDLTDLTAPGDLKKDRLQTVRGSVVDLDGRSLSGGRTLSAVLLDCGGEYVRGVWFNQNWVLRKFQPGETVLFSGKPKRKSGRWEFSHPRIQWINEDDVQSHGGVVPRYGLTEGLKMHEIRRIVREAVENYARYLVDPLPEPFREQNNLLLLQEAVNRLHQPADMDQYRAARRRLIFDDLLEFQLGLALRRRVWKQTEQAVPLPVTPKIDARIRRLFPFSFTEGQNRAVREICADLAREQAMHRLLQADVGAGKTAVAVYAMLVAIAAGQQAVLMAPTEVLASQHGETVEQLLIHSRVQRLLLTGSLTVAQRRQALADIKSGEIQLITGTQAVIQQDVEFAHLGLAVIDEQHKFGVMQRAHFSGGDVSPHVLVMTATPIPRTLCLTEFGDLDVTTISEMPPGRQEVITSRIGSPAAARKAWEFVRGQLQSGRQAFVVCPRIERTADQPGADPASAEDVYQKLSTGELRDFRVGLVHGRMDRRQRAEVMEAFRSGRTQVLVSTTVIEVGVDVPNATLMIVQRAESFGLSQLHQLRGRIARGVFRGYCFLFSPSDSPEAVQRLMALESTSDGFKIAERDFELRGPGDVLGTRQHGELPLKVADLTRDAALLDEARAVAFSLVDSQHIDQPAYVPLKIRVLERFGKLMDLPQSG